MKKILIALVFVSAFASVNAQTEVSIESNGTKVIKGFLTKKDLVTDTAFRWFAQNAAGYVPEQNALQAFKTNKDSIHVLAFAGTWCGDTKALLPKFYTLLDAAGFSQDRITLLGVDRNKKTIQHLSEAFNVTRVPTFIILKNGQEVGRVIEYGKTGMFDKELGEILTAHK